MEDLSEKIDLSPKIPSLGRDWGFECSRISPRNLKSDNSHPLDGQGRYMCLLFTCLGDEVRIDLGELQDRDEAFDAPGMYALVRTLGREQPVQCVLTCRAQLLEMICPVEKLHAVGRGTPLGIALESAMRTKIPLHLHRSASPEMMGALNKLYAFMSAGSGQLTPLALSDILEILWLFVQPGQRLRMPKASLRAAEEARSILASNVEEPPNLKALAACVSVSLSKLKQIFPQAHGIPPYAYLRLLRMERAMHLLHREGRNVTEAALEVGYSNLSHFSKIFALYHGVKPSSISKT